MNVKRESAGFWLVLISSAVLLSAGCRARRMIYQASDLPVQFMAPRHANPRSIDLSHLATAGKPSEVIQPGDLLQVTISTGLEKEAPISWVLRVSEQGLVNVPLVGPVSLVDQDLTAAEQIVRVESVRRGKYVDPNVAVQLVQHRSNRVNVVGAVTTPGIYSLPAANSDLLAAIVAAGGLTEEAGTTVEIRNPRIPFASSVSQAGSTFGPPPFGVTPAGYAGAASVPEFTTVDLGAAVTASADSLRVVDGATVMVRPRAKRYVFVVGLVNKPDQFELTDDHEMRLLDALALAGGRRLEIADTVHIIRQVEGRTEPVVIEASVKDAKQSGTANVRLAAGDVVSVEETPLTFVVGTFREFVRFGFTSAIPGL